MNITTIRYAKLHATAPYENERLELEATVIEGENVYDAYADLRDIVLDMIANPPRRTAPPDTDNEPPFDASIF